MKKLIHSVTPEELLNCDYIEQNAVGINEEDHVYSVMYYKYFNDKKKQGLHIRRVNGEWQKCGYKSLENAVKKVNHDIKELSKPYAGLPLFSKFYIVYSDKLKSHSCKPSIKKCKKFVNVEAMF